MDNRIGLNSATLQAPVVGRSKRLEKILGRDWKIALPFVLPMIVIMVGLVLYPFINAVALSTTSLNFLTGETVNVGMRN